MEHSCILLHNENGLCFCFYWFQSIPFCSQRELLRTFYNRPIGHLYDDAMLLLRRILQAFTFLCKLELLLFKLRWDNQLKKKMKGIAMTSSCKWPITCASKDEHGDLIFFFNQVKNFRRFKKLTCAFRACQKPIWHARHDADFGTRGMLGMLGIRA